MNDLTIFISFHLSHKSVIFANASCCAVKLIYNDLTRAAVVGVLERCTSLTAILASCSLSRPSAEGDAGFPFGRHSHTLPQFPKPICHILDQSLARSGRHAPPRRSAASQIRLGRKARKCRLLPGYVGRRPWAKN